MNHLFMNWFRSWMFHLWLCHSDPGFHLGPFPSRWQTWTPGRWDGTCSKSSLMSITSSATLKISMLLFYQQTDIDKWPKERADMAGSTPVSFCHVEYKCACMYLRTFLCMVSLFYDSYHKCPESMLIVYLIIDCPWTGGTYVNIGRAWWSVCNPSLWEVKKGIQKSKLAT